MSVGRRPAPLTTAQRSSRATTRSRAQGAVNQFLSPQISGGQRGVLQGIRATAGVGGLFGGAVDNAVDRTNTKFLAGNRLSGLEGILANTIGANDLVSGGVGASRALDLTKVQPILAQLQGLRNQFNFGGQAGLESVANLDPAQVGSFLGQADTNTLSLNIGRGGANIGRPGTTANDLARRFAESQGATDTGAFIRDNFNEVTTAVRRAALTGFDTPASELGEGEEGEDFQSVIFDRIRNERSESAFRADRGQEFVEGARGLNAARLLPFKPFLGGTPNAVASRTGGARELFSPLLFGSGR